MGKKPSVFLDTSVLFSAAWSETGASRTIFRLAEAGVIQIVISRQVLAEADGAMRRKNPDAITDLALLLECSRAEIVASANSDKVQRIVSLVGHSGDAQVLADAIAAGVDYFVTLDREHFLNNQKVRSLTKVAMGTPGDCLAWVRERLTL